MAFIVLQKKKGIQQIRKQPENENFLRKYLPKYPRDSWFKISPTTSSIKAKIDYIFDSIS